MVTLSGNQSTSAQKIEVDVVVAHRLNEEVTNDQRLLQIMQRLTQYQIQASQIVANTGEDYERAMQSFGLMKKDAQDLEALRKEKTAFPLAYKKAIDGLFKPFNDMLSRLMKDVGGKCTTWREAARAAAEKEAAEKVATATDEVRGEDGVGTFVPKGEVVEQLTQEPETVVPKTVTTDDGTKVQARKYTELTVTDKLALLKAIVSKNKRLDYLTLDLVTINEPALKRVIEANKKVKVPGVVIEKKERVQ